MSVRKRGKFYEARFTVENKEFSFVFNGKKGQPVITTKQEAITKQEDLRKEILLGMYLNQSDLRHFGKFFNDVFLKYSEQNKSKEGFTFDSIYGRRLLNEFGEKYLIQITPRMIEEFLVKLKNTKTRFNKPHSGVTVRKHYNMLNQLFNMAIRERVINDNPCRLVNPNILKQFPVWENRERWLNKYPAIEIEIDKKGNKQVMTEEERLFFFFNDQGEHLRAVTQIVLNTGIRPPKEVLAIKKEHINLKDEALYCKVGKNDILIPPRSVLVAKGKNGLPRCVPLNKIAFEVFSVLKENTATGEWLFTNRDGSRMKTIKKGFASACVRAKIDDFRAYDLRHTFATRLVERGVHHYVISALLGHTMPLAGFGAASKITPGYAHATWDSLVKAVETLEEKTESDKIRTTQVLLRRVS